MAKKKEKDKKRKTEECKHSSNKKDAKVNMQITEELLVHAIVQANRIIREEQEQIEKEQKQKEHEEWLKVLRQKECEVDANAFKRKCNTFRNRFMVIWSFLFIKYKDVKDARTTVALISMMTSFIFRLCKWILYVGSILLLWAAYIAAEYAYAHIIGAIFLWVIARLFRIASIEVEKMRDYNLLITIFSAIMSFLALIIAIIALWVGK